jgi:DNA-directed RNA polymerase specialized sigma24 family protein
MLRSESTDIRTVTLARDDSMEGTAGRRPTRWSLIIRAQGSGPEARKALGELIVRYERTVDLVVRRFLNKQWHLNPEDLKQEFFAGVIERGDLRMLDSSLGSFRGWLHKAVGNFMLNTLNYWKREKRDHRLTQSCEFQVLHESTAEREFMRIFAETTVIQARERLREQTRNKARFDQLARFLPGPQLDIAELGPLAAELGTSPGALAVANLKLRQDFMRVLREMVADTLDVDPSDPGFKDALKVELGLLYRVLRELPAHRVVLEDA